MTGRQAFWTDMKRLPNLLCLYRMAGICVAVGIFYLGHPIVAVSLGITAGLTDYFDGYFARKWNQVTRLGALLDTAADLLFNFVVLITACNAGTWPLYLLFAWGLRDIPVLAMRASAAQQGFTIPSHMLGKVASNFIFYSLMIFPFDYAAPFGREHWVGLGIHWLGLFAVHAGIAMQWISGIIYFRSFIDRYGPTDRAAA